MADHPVKVPAELFTEWLNEAMAKTSLNAKPGTVAAIMADRAAQWGADQELEACCEWLRSKDILEPAIDALRTTRRPKPPTLAEQALKAAYIELVPEGKHGSLIISALNRLAELEAHQ